MPQAAKRHQHYQSVKSAENDIQKRGAGGMKNYLKHTNNQNAMPSPRSDFSGGAMSNISSRSELKCQVNTSIKMKTPNQMQGPQKMYKDRNSVNDSL